MTNVFSYTLPFAAALGLPLLAVPDAKTGGPVVVVARPGSELVGTFDLIARADGRLLRSTAIPWIAVAVSDRPDFAAQLREAGAWAVIDAAQLAGCLTIRDPSDTMQQKDISR